MPNPHPKTEHLTKQKTTWNNLPTKATRVPEIFLEEIEKFARALDGQCSPFEAIISALDKLSKDELAQIKLAIECLSGNDIDETTVQTTLPDVLDSKDTLLNSNTAPSAPSLANLEFSNSQIAEYKAKFGFVPSRFQLGIIDWVINEKGNGCCNAVAGSGKSSTLRIVAKSLWETGLRPNEIKICVFGKDNSADLIKKFGPLWKSSISTLHSAAFTLIKKELGVKRSEDIIISKYKYEKIAQNLELVPNPRRNIPIGRLQSEKIISNSDDFLKLVDLVRLNNQEPTAKIVTAIANHHEIDSVQQPQLVAQWIAYCLKIGEEMAIQEKKLDYTDQIWLVVKWKLHERPWFKPYKFVLIDECQDLNPLQLAFVLMLIGSIGRILAVGDPRQAIMGFAGADNQSYNNIVRLTRAKELPLSICYRCPKSHIALVKKIFPNIPIEPAPDAIEGIIHQIEAVEIEKSLKNGDVIIGRKNAPLVSLCIKLIGQGVKATVKGRDVGDLIKKEIDLIAKMPGYSFEFFNDAVAQYKEIKLQRYRDLDNEEELKQKLLDKLEAILAIYQSQTQAKNVDNLKLCIDIIFSDTNSPITLSNIHKYKGGEAERIFIYKPNDLPMTWRNQQDWQLEQEENLLYVALTRSKSELFIVGYPDWYTPSANPNKVENHLDLADSRSNDYFSLLREAKEQLSADLTPFFPTEASRERLVKKLIEDGFSLQDLEDSGNIEFSSEKNRKAVYAAFNRYWQKFYAASRKDEEQQEVKRPSYRYAGMESEFWTGEDFYDDF
ncbi:UvrD-helicase domain-containing protein [Nostoc sp. C117]|uniref:UvrD-helicase domain-containing protein n=1 Tax=Nostoc sp. C117 TaxID=3349875 RepID=UPI00370D8793